jgi:Glycosyltransferase family 87
VSDLHWCPLAHLSARARTVAAAGLFIAALGIAALRVGVLTQVGGLRLGAPQAMNDFYSSVYYPVITFLDGENPYDRVRLKALHPEVEEYPPYLPLNLVLYIPFALLPPTKAAIAYFILTAALALPLSVVALRLAGSTLDACRTLLVAGLLLLSRPGHWALISGQHAIFLTLLSYLTLLYARRSPVLSGLALGVCMYKPTYGGPLALLMLAQGYVRPVGFGALVAAVANAPLLLVLTRRAGGTSAFLHKLLVGFQDWQSLKGMDPATNLDPMSFNRLDLATFVSRLVGQAQPSWVSIVCTAGVLGLTALGLRGLARRRERAEDLSLALLCLGMLICVYHMTYDIVLLTAPFIALLVHGLPQSGVRIPREWFVALFTVPCLNWALTQSALEAWQPSHGAWLAVASVNGACLIALFLGYLILALNNSGPAESFTTADSKGER